MTRGIHGRINHLYRCREDLIGIDLRCQCQFHSFFQFREVCLRDGYQCFQLVNLREHKYRLTAVELTVLVCLGGYNAVERSLDIRVRLQKIQLLFCRVVLRLNLVVLLLRSRTGLE